MQKQFVQDDVLALRAEKLDLPLREVLGTPLQKALNKLQIGITYRPVLHEWLADPTQSLLVLGPRRAGATTAIVSIPVTFKEAGVSGCVFYALLSNTAKRLFKDLCGRDENKEMKMGGNMIAFVEPNDLLEGVALPHADMKPFLLTDLPVYIKTDWLKIPLIQCTVPFNGSTPMAEWRPINVLSMTNDSEDED